MYIVTTNPETPFATGRWTDAQMAGTKMTNDLDIHRPFKTSDPQVQQFDEWGKLEGAFNNRAPAMMPFNALMYDQAANNEPWNDNELSYNRMRPTSTTARKPLVKKSQFAAAFADESQLPEMDAVDKQNFLTLYHKYFTQKTSRK